MAYEVVMPYHLHMPSYFLETFTEYPSLRSYRQLNSSLIRCFTSLLGCIRFFFEYINYLSIFFDNHFASIWIKIERGGFVRFVVHHH